MTRTASISVLLMGSAVIARAEPLRDGDIIFHTSRSAQSVAIQRATHSPCSHVGVVFIRDRQALPVRSHRRVAEAGDFDLTDPAVRAKMRERYGNRIALDEPVISPGAQFDSPLLKIVETR